MDQFFVYLSEYWGGLVVALIVLSAIKNKYNRASNSDSSMHGGDAASSHSNGDCGHDAGGADGGGGH